MESMSEPKQKILIIDDQMGAYSPHLQEGFRSSARLDDAVELTFFTGQTEKGKNSVELTIEKVRENWSPGEGRFWSLVLLDVRFDQDKPSPDDGSFGFVLLQALREEFGADLPIVMLTGEGGQTMRPAQNQKADGFLPKLVRGKDEGRSDGLRFAKEFHARLHECGLFPDIRVEGQRMIGESLPFLKFLRHARTCAVKGMEPLILGETGVGKTEIAKFIHDTSERAKKPFVEHTAQRLNDDLMKSAIFGEWSGAHNKSSHSQAGPIERAHEGTFFLDEVALLSPAVQELFLRVRDKKDFNKRNLRFFTRHGLFPSSGKAAEIKEAVDSIIGVPYPDLESLQAIGVDVRLLTATNERLNDPAERERLHFRNDLFEAFGTPFEIPPLNERREDIPLLFQFFVNQQPSGATVEIDREVLELLKGLDWKNSNIRGLQKAAMHAISRLSGFDVIIPDYLPADLLRSKRSGTNQPIEGHVEPEGGLEDEPPIQIPEAKSKADVGTNQGEYARQYESFLETRLVTLEEALESTRNRDSGTGEAGDYSPTNAVRRMLGVSRLAEKGETAEAKRIIKEILKEASQPKGVYRDALPDEMWDRFARMIDSSEALRSMT